MAGIATGLSDQDIADLAAYFSSQKRKRGVADKALLEAGQRLFRAGNPKTNVPACMACHGPGGDGIPLAGFPLLAGQHATYTASMLTRFKDGQSWGPNDSGSQIMDAVTLRMTADEIKAVASYIEGLHDIGPSSE
jgi:cytochrome c553